MINMKKVSLLALMPILLAGCGTKGLKIVVPTGAPAVAMAGLATEEGFITDTDPSKILAMMVAGNADVAVLPTNVGVQAINKQGLPFKMLCTITFGNFYVASTGHDDNGVMDETDYIVAFQQGAVPDKVFHYVHGTSLDSALHYVPSAQDAAKCLKLSKNPLDDNKFVDYVLIAEPALTTVQSSTPNVSVYEDLQSKYKEQSGGLILPQASVFVANTVKSVNAVYKTIESSIKKMTAEPDQVAELMNKVADPEVLFAVKPEVAVQVTKNGNRMGIDCKAASVIKDDINNFLSIFGVDGIKDESIAK